MANGQWTYPSSTYGRLVATIACGHNLNKKGVLMKKLRFIVLVFFIHFGVAFAAEDSTAPPEGAASCVCVARRA